MPAVGFDLGLRLVWSAIFFFLCLLDFLSFLQSLVWNLKSLGFFLCCKVSRIFPFFAAKSGMEFDEFGFCFMNG